MGIYCLQAASTTSSSQCWSSMKTKQPFTPVQKSRKMLFFFLNSSISLVFLLYSKAKNPLLQYAVIWMLQYWPKKHLSSCISDQMNDKRLPMRWRGPAYSQEQQVRDQLTLSCCWKQDNLSRSSRQTGSSHVLGYLKMIFFQRCRGCPAGSRRANWLNPVAQTTAASVITRQEQCNPLLHRPRAPFASGASPPELRVAPWTFREAQDGPMSTETSSHQKSSWCTFNLCNWFPTNIFPKTFL